MSNTKVREFTKACHKMLPRIPTALTKEEIDFVDTMVCDEMSELVSAKNIAEQADALVDAIYYLYDCAARKGINLDPLFDIVHEANMQKVVDGKVIRREDGKIMKPNCWIDPEPKLLEEIERQGKEGAFAPLNN